MNHTKSCAKLMQAESFASLRERKGDQEEKALESWIKCGSRRTRGIYQNLSGGKTRTERISWKIKETNGNSRTRSDDRWKKKRLEPFTGPSDHGFSLSFQSREREETDYLVIVIFVFEQQRASPIFPHHMNLRRSLQLNWGASCSLI